MKDEFCLNSKRWIKTMTWRGKAPKTCPKREDNFKTCQDCGYYQIREKSRYLLYMEKKAKDFLLKYLKLMLRYPLTN